MAAQTLFSSDGYSFFPLNVSVRQVIASNPVLAFWKSYIS